MDQYPVPYKKRSYAQAQQFMGSFSDKQSFYTYLSEQL